MLRRHRLGDVVIHAGLQAFLCLTLQGIGGHGDDGHAACGHALLALASADFRGGRVAIHLRHLAVHQHQIVGDPRERSHGFAPVGHGIHMIALFLQQAHGHPLVGGIVFDHQKAATPRRRQTSRATVGSNVVHPQQHPLPCTGYVVYAYTCST